MSEVHPEPGVAFIYYRLRRSVETEPCKHEILIAARGGPDDLLDHLRRDRSVLRPEYDSHGGLPAGVIVRLAHVDPSALCVDAGRTAACVNRIEARELHVLVVGEAHAVHLKQVHHFRQVRLDVLRRPAHLHLANNERFTQLLRLAPELRCVQFDGVSQRHLRRLDCLDRERPADARDPAIHFRLVH